MPGTDPGLAQGQPIPQTDVILCARQRQTHTKSADVRRKLNLQAPVYLFIYLLFSRITAALSQRQNGICMKLKMKDL